MWMKDRDRASECSALGFETFSPTSFEVAPVELGARLMVSLPSERGRLADAEQRRLRQATDLAVQRADPETQIGAGGMGEEVIASTCRAKRSVE